MKRYEQNQLMKNKILESAIKEFSIHDYNTASLNQICDKAGISKGIIYHYFENKDSLYLMCVEICFNNLIESSMKIQLNNHDLEENIIQYMQFRTNYFNENPEYKGLFYNAILRTPFQLKNKINILKHEFDKKNLTFFKNAFSKNNINTHITIDYAIEFLNIQINMFYEYFQHEADNKDIDNIIDKYEKQIRLWLEIILHGLIKEEK